MRLPPDVQANDSAFRIPLIDFSKFREAASPAEKRQAADNVVQAFKDVGFVYLTGHGIPETTISTVFQKVRASLVDNMTAFLFNIDGRAPSSSNFRLK